MHFTNLNISIEHINNNNKIVRTHFRTSKHQQNNTHYQSVQTWCFDSSELRVLQFWVGREVIRAREPGEKKR